MKAVAIVKPETGFWAWVKRLFTPIADQLEVYQTGWEEHPTLKRQRTSDIDYGGGGIGWKRITHPAGSLKLKQYRYWCSCGTELTDGPCGGVAVNAICKTCRINYGCLPGYWGT